MASGWRLVMRMKKTNWILRTIVTPVVLSLLLAGCNGDGFRRHRGASPGAIPSMLGCTSGTFEVCGTCASTTNFQQACYWAGGSIISADGENICKCQDQNLGSFRQYPSTPAYRLNPSNPSGLGTNVFYPGAQVRKGDVVQIRSSGYWSDDDTVIDLECDRHEADVDGKDEFDIELMNDGLHQGLMISDGAKVYEAGSNASVAIQNNGALRLGFNIPSGVRGGGCNDFSIQQLSITRCVTSQGQSTPCP